MLEFLPPVFPALIWGLTPMFYKSPISRFGALRVNFLRTAFASAVLLVPFLFYGFDSSIIFGSISGFLTLALGDTLFFISIGIVGASVATPLLYIQTILIELLAALVGETLTPLRVVSAILIIFGVFLLSRSGNSKAVFRGIAIGVGAAVLEAVGQVSLKLATTSGLSPFSISFSRTMTAMLVLGAIMAWRRPKATGNPSLGVRDYVTIASLAIGDIVIAASIYIYSIAILGIVFPTIMLGLSPLVTQIGSKGLRKESPKATDFAAGVIIALAILLSVV